MKNVNTNIYSLYTGPDDVNSASQAQQWCRQMLGAETAELTVWFFNDAVYHISDPGDKNRQQKSIYATWKSLAASGVHLRVCKAACQRRLVEAFINQDIFEISSLTQWADQVISTENDINCLIQRAIVETEFVREQIDPVLALLALDISVTVIFYPQALDHLLVESNWRQWRMLPEMEENVRLVAIAAGVKTTDLDILRARPGVLLESELKPVGEIVYV